MNTYDLITDKIPLLILVTCFILAIKMLFEDDKPKKKIKHNWRKELGAYLLGMDRPQ